MTPEFWTIFGASWATVFWLTVAFLVYVWRGKR